MLHFVNEAYLHLDHYSIQVVGELWRPAGGAYNVDGVLRVMVSGLEEELQARLSGSKVYAANKSPSSNAALSPQNTAQSVNATLPATSQNGASAQTTPPAEVPAQSLPVMNQGADVGVLFRGTKRVAQWVGRRFRRGKNQS